MFARRQFAAFVTVAATLQLMQPAGANSRWAKDPSALPPSSQTQTSAQQQVSQTQANFNKLVDAYFTASFKAHPNYATDAGIHDYDGKMPSYSKADIAKRTQALNYFLKRFSEIDPKQLDQTSRIDRQMLIADANSQLLELNSIQSWKRNPDVYSGQISSSIFSLMKRNFASPEQRLKSVIEREQATPAILASARTNLENTPKIYVEIALEQLPGMISFFKDAVPQAFASVKDADLQKQFQASNAMTIKELSEYQSFLHDKVLPKSVANFAIGKENYQKKLAYDEMVDEPVDSLLARGYTELHRLQKQFNETAHKIDPSKTPNEVFAGIAAQHPKPDELLPSVKGVLSDLHDKCEAYVTMPSEDKLLVQETPPFMRATTFASMDAPGPFEKVAKEAYYQVTLPEKDWDPKRTEEHMRFFSTLDIVNTSVHEAYPGHYVQGLWAKQAPSKTRKLLGCGSNIEGWAHYCEELMADARPNDLPLKLVQIHDAMLRACRYIVGIEMHTKGMTVAQAKDFFVTQGDQEPANAEREAKRGTSDPTYLVYTLGKLQILALRDEYKKLKGDKFDLKDFHDKFLAQGYVPVKLIRETMISQ